MLWTAVLECCQYIFSIWWIYYLDAILNCSWSWNWRYFPIICSRAEAPKRVLPKYIFVALKQSFVGSNILLSKVTRNTPGSHRVRIELQSCTVQSVFTHTKVPDRKYTQFLFYSCRLQFFFNLQSTDEKHIFVAILESWATWWKRSIGMLLNRKTVHECNYLHNNASN